MRLIDTWYPINCILKLNIWWRYFNISEYMPASFNGHMVFNQFSEMFFAYF